MSMDPSGRRRGTPPRIRTTRGALGQTYGYAGRAPYGPTAPAGWTGPPVAATHGTQRPGATVTLGSLRRQPLGYAQIPYGNAPTQGGQIAAKTVASTGAGVAAAATGLVGAAGVSATVPIAGWIIGGGLVAAAGVILLVDAFRKKGVKAAKMEAIAKGYPLDFANEYAKLATGTIRAVEKAKDKWAKKVRKEQEDVRKAKQRLDAKPNSKSRKNRYERQKRQLQKDIDRYNAASVVEGLKKTVPSEAVIAGVQASVPTETEKRGAVANAVWEITSGDTGKILLGVGAAGAAAYIGTRLLTGR